MKKKNKKLSLNAQTIVPLTPDALTDVNGGTGGLIKTAVQVSKAVCTTVTTVTTLQSNPRIGCK